MGDLIRVYFDTNIWSHLAQTDNKPYLEIIREYKQTGILRIFISVLNFAETTGLSSSNFREELYKRACLIASLAHKQPLIEPYSLIQTDYFLPPRKRRLRPVYEDQRRYLSSMSRLIRISGPIRFESSEMSHLKKYYERFDRMGQLFKQSEREFIQKIKKDIPTAPNNNPFSGASDFLDYIEKRGCQQSIKLWMKEQGITRARSSDKPLLYFGLAGRLWKAWVFYLYRQLYGGKNYRPDKSDYADCFHIVYGGVVGKFVSDDSNARDAFNFAWGDVRRIKVYSLGKFVSYLHRARRHLLSA
jgi:hypothetical protein